MLKRMSFQIESRVGENLYLVMYALCAAKTLDVTLPAMFPRGVGVLSVEGKRNLIIRGMYMLTFFVLCSLSFIVGFVFCNSASPSGFAPCSLYIFIICILSMNPWFCDHLARILFYPAKRWVQIREPQFKYVDVLFVGIYVPLVSLLWLFWNFVTSTY
jgi:hypothetical protein